MPFPHYVESTGKIIGLGDNSSSEANINNYRIIKLKIIIKIQALIIIIGIVYL